MVHVLYNLRSLSLQRNLPCVLVLKLGQHCLCLVAQTQPSNGLGVST